MQNNVPLNCCFYFLDGWKPRQSNNYGSTHVSFFTTQKSFLIIQKFLSTFPVYLVGNVYDQCIFLKIFVYYKYIKMNWFDLLSLGEALNRFLGWVRCWRTKSQMQEYCNLWKAWIYINKLMNLWKDYNLYKQYVKWQLSRNIFTWTLLLITYKDIEPGNKLNYVLFLCSSSIGTVCSWGLLPFSALLAYNLNTNKIFLCMHW